MVDTRKAAGGEIRSLRSDTQHTRVFYKRCGADPIYDHCHRVSKLQMQVGITEPKVLLDPKESPERKHANSVVHNGALLHALDASKISRITVPLPPALDDPDVLELVEKMGLLTNLDRAGAPNSHYTGLLNGGGRPSLALLVKLADYAVTHTTEDMLNGLIDPKHASAFRTYDSKMHAHDCMRNEARAGERIYAPIAELFGYPQLAGTIMNHAYQINHPEIHAHVMTAMADELFQTRLALTQKIVRQIASHIKAELKRYGFEAEVTLRQKKSEGKIMRKVYRLMKADYEATKERERFADEVCSKLDAIAEGKEHTPTPEDSPKTAERLLGQYMRSAIKGFDFDRLNDWVAARVVLKTFKGHKIYTDSGTSFKLAQAVIEHALSMQQIINGCLEINHDAKRGRYNADHYDAKTQHGREAPEDTPLNHEVQLKTGEWHDIAEHGKAAHYYYLGGYEDREFMDTIAKAYHEILHSGNGNGKR